MELGADITRRSLRQELKLIQTFRFNFSLHSSPFSTAKKRQLFSIFTRKLFKGSLGTGGSQVSESASCGLSGRQH